MAEGFALLDPDFRIIDMNAEAMRYEARPREEVIGKTHWEAHPHATRNSANSTGRDGQPCAGQLGTPLRLA
jgi:PAS domain-containing protein